MTDATDTSARAYIKAQLRPLLPARWQYLDHEAAAAGDVVRVRVTVREITASDTGDAGAHRVTVHVTVTVPGDSLEQAEDDLDDAMDLFLFALDRTGLPWSRATKGRFADEGRRLGYEFDITDIRTTPTEES